MYNALSVKSKRSAVGFSAVSAAMRLENKLRKRALHNGFLSFLHARVLNTLAYDFHWSLHQQPRNDPATKRLFRVLSRMYWWTTLGKRTWFKYCFNLARSFDRWFLETGTGRPLWIAHGRTHRRRQAFGRWKAWAKRRHVFAAKLVRYRGFGPAGRREVVHTTRNRCFTALYFVERFFMWWKRCHSALRVERFEMLATRHMVGSFYAKWGRFRLQVRAQRAARDLLREEAQESSKKSPSKRKKKKGKRVADIITIEADVETIVQNLADMKTIEHDIPPSAYVDVADVADSSVATSLTCVVCFHGASDYAIVPCGHKCLCEQCSTKFKGAAALCPVCRGSVQMTMKIFG